MSAEEKTEPNTDSIYFMAAEAFVKDYRKMDEGEPYAFFNFIRLSNLYAVACVCYYEHDMPPMNDHTFDGLCKFLLDHYDQAMDAGTWEGTLDKGMLAAGSGYHSQSFRVSIHNIAYYTQLIVSKQQWKGG